MALCVIEGPPAFGAVRSMSDWIECYKAEGSRGTVDRLSRPGRNPNGVDQAVIEHIIALRRQRWTCQYIAQKVGVSPATVNLVLKRAGLSRLKNIDPAEPVRRYERSRPGERVRLDIKKLGKFKRMGHRITADRHRQSNQRNNDTAPGWEFVHVCVDDHSRLSFTTIHADEKAVSAISHPKASSSRACGRL